MKRTICAMMGKGSVSHNSRQFKASNIDRERSHLNVAYRNTPIQDVYHELFDDALRRYNEKQTRSDRRIDNYYEKIRTGKQEKLFYEAIFQVGKREDMSATSQDGPVSAAVLNEFMCEFEKRNPCLKVFSAHLHMDEATPHLHIDFVPFTTGSKRGLDTRVSLKKALANQGFEGGSRGDTEWNQWINAEKKQLAQVMERHNIHWEQLDTHNKHLSVLEFKTKQRTKEIAAQEQEIKVQDEKLKDGTQKLNAVKQEIMDGKARLNSLSKGVPGVIAKKKRLEAIQPEQGMLGTIKGVTLEDIQDIKRTALEYHILAEQMKELGIKYQKLKSKVPTETENLETEKKFSQLRKLEKSYDHLHSMVAHVKMVLEKFENKIPAEPLKAIYSALEGPQGRSNPTRNQGIARE